MKKIIALPIILSVLLGLAVMGLYRLFPMKYGDIIEKYAEEYGLPKSLVCGVIYAESGFNKEAHSGLARGLMQLTDETALWIAENLGMEYEPDMAEEPEINIKMGCYYLAHLTERYQNTETALAAYNGGMGNVTKWLADEGFSHDGITLYRIPYRETRGYVKRVRIFTYIYRKLYYKKEN